MILKFKFILLLFILIYIVGYIVDAINYYKTNLLQCTIGHSLLFVNDDLISYCSIFSIIILVNIFSLTQN